MINAQKLSLLGTVYGDIAFDAVLKEAPSSSATVTKNPVESGAQITDHFYVNPKKLDLQVGVSNTPLQAVAGDIVSKAGGALGSTYASGLTRASAAWQILNAIQASGKPFTAQYGFGLMQNMVITNLSSARQAENAGALIADITLEEIITTQVQTALFVKAKLKPAAQSNATAQSTGKASADPAKTKSTALAAAQFFGALK